MCKAESRRRVHIECPWPEADRPRNARCPLVVRKHCLSPVCRDRRLAAWESVLARWSVRGAWRCVAVRAYFLCSVGLSTLRARRPLGLIWPMSDVLSELWSGRSVCMPLGRTADFAVYAAELGSMERLRSSRRSQASITRRMPKSCFAWTRE